MLASAATCHHRLPASYMERLATVGGVAKPTRAPSDSVHGGQTAGTREWAIAYIARHHEMLDLMARM